MFGGKEFGGLCFVRSSFVLWDFSEWDCGGKVSAYCDFSRESRLNSLGPARHARSKGGRARCEMPINTNAFTSLHTMQIAKGCVQM